LAQAFKANISVVYAYRLFVYAVLEEGEAPVGINELGEDALKFFSTELAARVEEPRQRLKTDTIETGIPGITTDLIEGINPAIGIVEYADNKDMDLIVINTHARKGIKKFIMGSVTEKIVQESSCPVLVIKP
jgi:nucleotide-binding universal stress UspA family protein